MSDSNLITAIKKFLGGEITDRTSDTSRRTDTAQSLTDLDGVGSYLREQLANSGYDSVDAIAAASVSELTEVQGVGTKRARYDSVDAIAAASVSELTEVQGVGTKRATDLSQQADEMTE